MTLWVALRATKGSHWKDALIWLGFTCVGTLLPFFGGWLLLFYLRKNPSWEVLANNSEFALYSAGMLASAFYVLGRDFVGKDSRTVGFPGRWLFLLLGLAGVVVATLFYAAVTLAVVLPIAPEGRDEAFQRNITVSLFFASALIAYLVNVLENQRLDPAFHQLVNQSQSDFEKRFDNVR